MENNNFLAMVEAVKKFHEKHGYDIGTESHDTMLYRTNLLTEELGELAQAVNKGKSKEDIAEEHADLLIVLIGNAITMNMDLGEAFWKKMAELDQRKPKLVGNRLRVSAWKE